MESASYEERKLEALAEEGMRRIVKGASAVRDQFIKAGQSGGSRQRIYILQAIEDGLRETLERMARWMIDAKLAERQEALQTMRVVAQRLANRSIDAYAATLFGGPASDPAAMSRRLQEMPPVSARLMEMIDLTIDDVAHVILGHAGHSPATSGPSVNATGEQLSILMNSPGSNVQLGRDNLSQNSVIQATVAADLRTFVASVEEQASRLGLDESRHAELVAELETIKAQLNSPRPKPGIVSACLSTVKNILEAATAQLVANPLAQTAQEVMRAIGFG